jgi:cellulose synthase/poly-beta-1,6-N-acetylglucosamine synthase-like glycosyltransferase
MIESFFWIAGSLLVYTFFVYPLLLTVLARVWDTTRHVDTSNFTWPKITVIVPAYNEADVIGRKIRNIRECTYQGEVELVIASDGSRDGTGDIVRNELGGSGIFLDEKVRRGKTSIINKAVAAASGELLIFTDANVLLSSDALECIARPFVDAEVGCVQGQLSYTNEQDSCNAANGSLYWRYEESIKMAESQTGSLIGADGSLFAVRRNLFRQLPEHVLDDFCTSIGVLSQGYRAVFEPGATAYERATVYGTEEFQRKIRIATRSISSFLFLAHQLRGIGSMNWFKMISHKVLRWGSGLLMLIVLLSNTVLVAQNGSGETNTFYVATLLLQFAFYVIGGAFFAIHPRNRTVARLFSIPAYFLLTVAATTVGVVRGLFGVAVPFWAQMKTTR